jgi:hypothetical protein
MWVEQHGGHSVLPRNLLSFLAFSRRQAREITRVGGNNRSLQANCELPFLSRFHQPKQMLRQPCTDQTRVYYGCGLAVQHLCSLAEKQRKARSFSSKLTRNIDFHAIAKEEKRNVHKILGFLSSLLALSLWPRQEAWQTSSSAPAPAPLPKSGGRRSRLT